MESAGKRENIIMRLHGFETELAIVGDAVFVEGAAVADHIETGAEVGAMADARRRFDASAQKRSLHADTEAA